MKNKNKIVDKQPNLPSGNPFEVPARYFESFPSRLQEKIGESQEVVESSESGGLFKLKPYFALAAMIVGFTIIGYTGFRYILDKQTMHGGLSDEEIISYLESNSGYFYDDQLYDVQLEEGTETIEEELSEEIIEYLVEDEIDYNTLINELESLEDKEK
jgi:hypothetical protein